MHGIHLPQMIKTFARQASGMGCKGQCTVEQHTEAHCFGGDHDVNAPNHIKVWRSNTEADNHKTSMCFHREICSTLVLCVYHNKHHETNNVS